MAENGNGNIANERYKEEQNNSNKNDWIRGVENGKRMTSNILCGTSQCNETELAADITLVAYGVAKHVTETQLARFLESKGMDIVDCSRLTTYENARSLSYKVTIKAKDYEKSKDPTTWPFRVSVRPFKEKRIKTASRDSQYQRIGSSRKGVTFDEKNIYNNSPKQSNINDMRNLASGNMSQQSARNHITSWLRKPVNY